MSSDAPSPTTLAGLLFHVRDVSGGRTDLLRAHFPSRRETLSTTDFLRQVHALAIALETRGLETGQRVALVSENRPEWHVVDFACHLLGAPTVPISPATPKEQVAYVLRNSGARWVFYGSFGQREVLREVAQGLSSPPEAVAFDADDVMDGKESLTRLQGEGSERLGDVPLERFRGRASGDDLATLLYTSGTTGDPKGVMLSHRNLMSNVVACSRVFDLGARDLALSFLPLSQIFQRTVDYLCFFRGARIDYVPDPELVPRILETARPTLMAAAPAFYQRAHREVSAEIEALPAWRRRLVRWALRIGGRYAEAGREGFIGPLLALEHRLARHLFHRRVQERFGGRLRLAISGGAPLPEGVAAFFDAVGMPLYQGYGLTETSPVLATNTPEEHRPGSVGKPLSDVELRIAEDGEILVRGPGVMQGYWQNAGATAATVSESGWLRTGDLGRMDKSGYVFITDRKQDLLVLSTGDNVTPRPIEVLLTQGAWIDQAVVVGDGKPHTAALLVASERLRRLGAEHPDEEGGWRRSPAVLEKIEALLEEVNLRLASANRLGGFRLLEKPFTVEDGELTPTLKIRRKEITRRYAREISELYSQ